MAIKAWTLFGEIELRDAKLKSGVRSADAQFRHLENHAKSTVRNVNNELSRMGQFKSNLNQGFMSSFGIQGGGGSGSLIGSAAGNLLQSGARAIFGHVTEAIDKGLQMKDLIEQMRIAFTNLTGSEEKAVAHMKEMFKFGADTPFQTREILEYSQKLQAVGFTAGEVKQALTDMGDAMSKAGSFQYMDKAMKAITDMLSKGSLTSEELKGQLGDALPGAFKIASRALGVDSAELTKLMADGRIEVEAFVRLLLLQMRKESAGAMEATAKSTLLGLESTLEDAKLMTYAQGVTGGDPFGPAAGAYAQRRENIQTQIANYSGPQAKGVAEKIGWQAETYLKGVGMLEENAFKSSPGRDTIMKMFSDPKGAAADIYNGLTQGISQGTGVVTGALSSMSNSMWDTWTSYWETNSPSERTKRLGVNLAEGLHQGLRERLLEISKDPLVKSFFDAIQKAEGGQVNVMAGGRRVNSGRQHPGEVVPMSEWFRGDKGPSSAAGNYQITRTNWRRLAPQLGLDNFSDPQQQLIAALKIFADRKDGAGMRALLSGDIRTARNVAALDWTSTPGSKIGGGGQLSDKRWMGYFHAALGANGAAVSSSNPMPVAVVNFGGFSGGADGKITGFTGGANGASVPRYGGSAGLNLPFGVGGTASLGMGSPALRVTAELEPITEALLEIAPAASLTKRPLIDVAEALKGLSALDDEMAALRKEAIKPEEAEKKKKDRLFDKAFTREGVAGDFQGGFASLLSGLGWEKPGSLLRQFGIGLVQSIQGRIANDLSAMLTGSLFGNRGENGQLSGGLLQSLFGGLFGGGRASGGSVSGGRLYMFGERGPELGFIAPGSSGHIYNNRQTQAMLGGSDGRQEIFVAIGDVAVGQANDRWRSQPRGRRSRFVQAKYGRKLNVGWA